MERSIRIGFNPTRSTSPCYNTAHACNNTCTKINLTYEDKRTLSWAGCPSGHRTKALNGTQTQNQTQGQSPTCPFIQHRTIDGNSDAPFMMVERRQHLLPLAVFNNFSFFIGFLFIPHGKQCWQPVSYLLYIIMRFFYRIKTERREVATFGNSAPITSTSINLKSLTQVRSRLDHSQRLNRLFTVGKKSSFAKCPEIHPVPLTGTNSRTTVVTYWRSQ